MDAIAFIASVKYQAKIFLWNCFTHFSKTAAPQQVIFYTIIVLKQCNFNVNLWAFVFCVMQKLPKPLKRSCWVTVKYHHSHTPYLPSQVAILHLGGEKQWLSVLLKDTSVETTSRWTPAKRVEVYNESSYQAFEVRDFKTKFLIPFLQN